MPILPAEVITTAEQTEYSIIWLHGLGADGHDFVPIIPELKLPDSLRIKFIFPHAPVRPVTVNNGMQIPAWYDLLALEGITADEADILTTVGWINEMISAEIERGTPAEKIILAGFSQGGVIALHAGLRYPQKLAGIMALSTYMPFDDKLLQEVTAAQQGVSIFAAHGTQDPVVTFKSWQHYVPVLKNSGFNVEEKSYEMAHSLCAEEIKDISTWIQSVLD